MSVSGTSEQLKLFCKKIFLTHIHFSDVKSRTSHFALSCPDASDVDINSDIWCYIIGTPCWVTKGDGAIYSYTDGLCTARKKNVVCVLQIIPPLVLHLKLLIFFSLPASSVSLLPLHTCWAEGEKKPRCLEIRLNVSEKLPRKNIHNLQYRNFKKTT